MVATGYVKWVLSSTSGHQANWWHPLTLLMYLELYRGRNMLSCPLKAIIASLAEQFWRRGFSWGQLWGQGKLWTICCDYVDLVVLDFHCCSDECIVFYICKTKIWIVPVQWMSDFPKKKFFFLPWLCRNNPGTRNFIMKVSAVKRSLKRWELNWTVNRSGNFLSLEGRGV